VHLTFYDMKALQYTLWLAMKKKKEKEKVFGQF